VAERVAGIGGVFFRARDPAALRAWYAKHLGIDVLDYGTTFTAHEGDQTVWAPFAADTDYFGTSGQQLMINFRVGDLDGMLEQLCTRWSSAASAGRSTTKEIASSSGSRRE
jgi:glyoxylase I family protein